MKLNEHAEKLLQLLRGSGIDAMPVKHEEDQIVLFFENDKFLIHVDPRTPIVWLKGAHDKESNPHSLS